VNIAYGPRFSVPVSVHCADDWYFTCCPSGCAVGREFIQEYGTFKWWVYAQAGLTLQALNFSLTLYSVWFCQKKQPLFTSASPIDLLF